MNHSDCVRSDDPRRMSDSGGYLPAVARTAQRASFESTALDALPLANAVRQPKETAQEVIDRDSPRSPGHDPERHCRPGDMDWPAVGHGEFNDHGHEQ